MTGPRLILPALMLAATLAALVRGWPGGAEQAWLPMLLVSVGGAVLALVVSHAISRRAGAR